MRIFLATLFPVLSLVAQPSLGKEAWPVFTSADGSKTLKAKPIDLDGDKIVFIRANKSQFAAKPQAFSKSDQTKLQAWKQRLLTDPHRRVIRRVAEKPHLRVLFIGNSYSFKCPNLFKKIAQTEGKTITVEQETHGGWTLAKHAASAKTLNRISNGKWDIVILQEQSQIPSFPEHQRAAQMYPAAKTLAKNIRNAGALPVFYLTWGRLKGDRQNSAQFPNDTFQKMQQRLTQGYTNAARAAGNPHIIPIGKAWAEVTANKQLAAEALYTGDGSHPSLRGNHLIAATIFSSFYNVAAKKTKNSPLEDYANIAYETARYLPPNYPAN